MGSGPTRREFMEAAGVTVGLGGLASRPLIAGQAASPRVPRIAAVVTVYHYLSHAYHIVGRFLDGFVLYDAGGGSALHKPAVEVASLFIEQT
ncbi:MAG: twin-arginine translocation signal domain-containing protein, partial [Isosphaeraceae bacterium]